MPSVAWSSILVKMKKQPWRRQVFPLCREPVLAKSAKSQKDAKMSHLSMSPVENSRCTALCYVQSVHAAVGHQGVPLAQLPTSTRFSFFINIRIASKVPGSRMKLSRDVPTSLRSEINNGNQPPMELTARMPNRAPSLRPYVCAPESTRVQGSSAAGVAAMIMHCSHMKVQKSLPTAALGRSQLLWDL